VREKSQRETEKKTQGKPCLDRWGAGGINSRWKKKKKKRFGLGREGGGKRWFKENKKRKRKGKGEGRKGLSSPKSGKGEGCIEEGCVSVRWCSGPSFWKGHTNNKWEGCAMRGRPNKKKRSQKKTKDPGKQVNQGKRGGKEGGCGLRK